MNSKLIVVGAISAAVGAVVSWAVTADYYEQRTKLLEDLAEGYENLLRQTEDEVYELRQQSGPMMTINNFVANPPTAEELLEVAETGAEAFTKTSSDLIAEAAAKHADEEVELVYDPDPDTGVVEIVSSIEEVDGEAVIPSGETEANTRTNLQELIDDYVYKEEDRDEFVAAVIDPPGQSDATPFVISRELFSWDEEEGNNYDKITLTYYPTSRLLLDEEEEPIDNPAIAVGWRNLQQFGSESGDVDTVFIRNRRLRTDFEVVRELEEKPPLHVQFGMGKEEFRTRRAAGLIRLPDDA